MTALRGASWGKGRVATAVTKFAAGAWILVILIPTIVIVCRRSDADGRPAPLSRSVDPKYMADARPVR